MRRSPAASAARPRNTDLHGRRSRGEFSRGRKPVLEAMGKRIVHCGAAGSGQAAKICNNMILGVTMAAVGEAFVLGERSSACHTWRLFESHPPPGPVMVTQHLLPSGLWSRAGHRPPITTKAGVCHALMLKALQSCRKQHSPAAPPRRGRPGCPESTRPCSKSSGMVARIFFRIVKFLRRWGGIRATAQSAPATHR